MSLLSRLNQSAGGFCLESETALWLALLVVRMPQGTTTTMGNSPVSTPKSQADVPESSAKTSPEVESVQNLEIVGSAVRRETFPTSGSVTDPNASTHDQPSLDFVIDSGTSSEVLLSNNPSPSTAIGSPVDLEASGIAPEPLPSEQLAATAIPDTEPTSDPSKKSGYTKTPANNKAKAAQRCGKSRTTHSPTPAPATAAVASKGAPNRVPSTTSPAARRRPSNAKGKKNQTIVPWTVDDPAPLRLVNPLVDLPSDGVLVAGDLWPLLDMTFPLPDTFSIAYLARVLGYRAPTVVPPHRTYTPVPFVRGSLERPHDAIYDVPPLGPTILPQHDNTDLGGLRPDQLDPFFTLLLESKNDDSMAPVTATQLAKLNFVLTPTNLVDPSPLQSTMDLAAELGVLQDHQVSTWYEGKDKSNAGLSANKNKDGLAAPGSAGDTGTGTCCGVALWRGDEAVAQAAYTFAWHPCGSQKYELVLVLYNVQTATISFMESGVEDPQEEVCTIVLMACVLEHARMCHVHYAVTPQDTCLQTYFRMISSNGRLVCDLNNCSSRYAFLRYREHVQKLNTTFSPITEPPKSVLVTHRWLAQLPTAQEVLQMKSLCDSGVGSDSTSAEIATGIHAVATSPAPKVARKKSSSLTAKSAAIGSRPVSNQSTTVSYRAHLQPDGGIRVESKPNSTALDRMQTEKLHFDLLRHFEVTQQTSERSNDNFDTNSEVLRWLQQRQQLLLAHETKMRSSIHWLMGKVIEERAEFEYQARTRQEEREILEQYRCTLDRRKELDMAWQKQLEQDMDAVCDVCADGEVTPDNQILFCEACNVAVHQMCYGIDKIPEGDYYCIACRYLGRNLPTAVPRSSQHVEFATLAPTKVSASPLPICCEICPRKQGAFIRTDVRNLSDEERTFGKWVHAVCAKWLGLDYVTAPDLVEDVTEWKWSFRRMGLKCDLCQGERGCMNKCSFDGCNTWLHVTCARAVKTCDVVHGEDVKGAVTLNPWSLRCTEHSSDKCDEFLKDATSIETLVQSAKEFPPEPPPPPLSIEWKPFNTATGEERSHLLRDKSYERSLLLELTLKKVFGVCCEVCDQDIDPKLRMRCHTCGVIFCKDCSLAEIDGVDNYGNFKCAACSFVASKEKTGEEYETPQCLVCYQKSGWLRKATAKPFVGKKRARRISYDESTFFGKQLWVHSVCTLYVSIVIHPTDIRCSGSLVSCYPTSVGTLKSHLT